MYNADSGPINQQQVNIILTGFRKYYFDWIKYYIITIPTRVNEIKNVTDYYNGMCDRHVYYYKAYFIILSLVRYYIIG